MSLITPPVRLTERTRAVALFVVPALLVWLVVVHPILGLLNGPHREMEQEAQRLAAYQTRAAAAPALAKALKTAQSDLRTTPGLLSDANAALAASAIQSRVRRVADTVGGSIRSTSNLAPSMTGAFEAVPVRFDVTLPMSQLSSFLYKLEYGTPYLFVDDVDITAPQSMSPGSSTGPNVSIETRMTLTGYRIASVK